MRFSEIITEVQHPKLDSFDAKTLASMATLGGYDIGDMRMSARSIAAILNRLKKVSATGQIKIWRALSVPEGWETTLKPGTKLGTHRSYRMNGVGLYGDNSGRPDPYDDSKVVIVLQGLTGSDNIEWTETVAANIERGDPIALTLAAGASRPPGQAPGGMPLPLRGRGLARR